jgi:hypothetical protein
MACHLRGCKYMQSREHGYPAAEVLAWHLLLMSGG